MNRRTRERILEFLAAAGAALLLSSSAAARGGPYDRMDAMPGRSCEIKLDLNRATVAELDELQGIRGPTASGIVEYRETHGPYRDVTELLDAKDMDARSFSILRDRVTVVDPADATAALATPGVAYVWRCTGG